MRVFDWFSRVPTDTSPHPTIRGDFETALFDVLAEEDLRPLNSVLDTATDCAISDLFIHIEYSGIDGGTSKRPITIKKEVKNLDRVSLVAMCHQSNDLKWFRLDRIAAVYSVEGKVYRPASTFWDLIGYAPDRTDPDEDKAGRTMSAARIKIAYKHQLRVLAALAGADGHLHDKEVEAIVAYLVAEVSAAGKSPDAQARTGLAEHIRRMRVTRDCLDTSLDNLFGAEGDCALQPAELSRFLTAARHVVDADGLFHKAEFEFLDYLETTYLDENSNLFGAIEPGSRTD